MCGGVVADQKKEEEEEAAAAAAAAMATEGGKTSEPENNNKKPKTSGSQVKANIYIYKKKFITKRKGKEGIMPFKCPEVKNRIKMFIHSKHLFESEEIKL